MADKNTQENSMIGNDIFITTNINEETTSNMIKSFARWVQNATLPRRAENDQKNKQNKPKIIAPYDAWPAGQPVLNIYLATPGGDAYVLQSILTLMHMAQAKGTIVRTYNISRASSCGSLIAVSGNKGYRYMAENAYNLIHYGHVAISTIRQDEVEYQVNTIKEHTKLMEKIYLQTTKLSKQELAKFFETEGAGKLSASQCLQKGICDWIITNDGKYINCLSR